VNLQMRPPAVGRADAATAGPPRKARNWGPKPGTSAKAVSTSRHGQERCLDLRLCGGSDEDGGTLKWLTLVDEYTRECLELHVARTISGQTLRRVLAEWWAGAALPGVCEVTMVRSSSAQPSGRGCRSRELSRSPSRRKSLGEWLW